MKVPGKMLPKIIGFIFKKPVTVLYPKGTTHPTRHPAGENEVPP